MSIVRSSASPGRAGLLAACVFAASCEDEPTTMLAPPPVSAETEVQLILPALSADALVAIDTSTAGAPARVLSTEETEPLPPAEETITTSSVPASDIWNEETGAAFGSGYFEAWGHHDYMGNKGSVLTTADIRYGNVGMGSQTSYREDSFPFLLGWMSHYILTIARVYIEGTCGFSGDGSSRHEAWWQASLGGATADFGQQARSTWSEVARQPDCPTTYVTYTGGGGGGDNEAMCFILIEYDIYSGEIYDAQLLYCTEGG